MASERLRVGIVGARGYTGSELLRLLARHHSVEVVYAGSRELVGAEVEAVPGLRFDDRTAEHVAALELDGLFLALPNGLSGPWTEVIPARTVIVDISADHRFDDEWAYGLPELFRDKISGARRVANPGCYATAAQIALAPFAGMIDGVPAVFGVSGYSGAGTTPSPKNDPERLADSLIPYKLVDHIHEREMIRHLGMPVRFMPHVHQTFRGLLVTVHLPLSRPLTADLAHQVLVESYGSEPLIQLTPEIPELRDGADIAGVVIGGVEVSEDGHNLVLVAVEDNLLKGAAVQAIQNLNLSLGIPELTGII